MKPPTFDEILMTPWGAEIERQFMAQIAGEYQQLQKPNRDLFTKGTTCTTISTTLATSSEILLG